MNKRIVIGLVAAVALVAVLLFAIFGTEWFMNSSTPVPIPFDPGSEHIDHNSLNYQVFQHYGPLLIILAVLMFGAIVGGICVAREEIEKIDESEKKNEEVKE